jgi:hypothetical protein
MSEEDTTTQALAGITWLSEQTPETLREMLGEAPPAERRELLDTMARVSPRCSVRCSGWLSRRHGSTGLQAKRKEDEAPGQGCHHRPFGI